jgi:Acyltransferase family
MPDTAAAAKAEHPPPAAPPAAAAAPRERRLDLDRAKGIAILLVVFGHVVAREVPPGVGWYEPLRYAVYRFHMPFFLYLSGTVVVLGGLLATPPGAWAGLLRRRAARLLLPFFLLGLLILAAKLLAAGAGAHVDNPPAGLWGGLRDLFWTTGRSPALTVWYLMVLFLSTAVALPLAWAGLGTTGLVALGLALQFVEPPPIAYLDRFASHFLFFAAGCWAAERQAALLPAFERWQWAWWPLFGASLGLALAGVLDARGSLVACGLLCIPALHGMVRLPPVSRWSWPIVLGAYAMAIYLFNTLAIGGAKAALILAGIGWTAPNFPIHAAVLMAAGVALPIAFRRLVLRRVPALDRMTA